MRTITIDQKKFKLEEFIEANIAFIKTFVEPDGYSFPEVGGNDAAVYHDDFTSRNIKDEINKGRSLYFLFSGYDIDRDVACIDGKRYSVEDDHYNEDVYILDEPDTVGYVIQKKGNDLVFYAAAETSNFVEYPQIQKHSNFGVFNKPLENYIRRFIK